MDVWLELMRAVGRLVRTRVCYSGLRGLLGRVGAAKQVSEKVPPFETSRGLMLLRGGRRHI